VRTVDFSGAPFHFIGIGGIGMSALAYVLAKRHLPVSGSDLRSNNITKRLQSVGAHIFYEQKANNLDFFGPKTTENGHGESGHNIIPQVICSTAISNQNLEYQAAEELGYPIFHRSDILAALMLEQPTIAVAGTHGKTTTSSLIGYVLLQAGLDPTIVIGGEVEAWQGNAHLGSGNLLVAEADESDGSLAKYSPKMGVITNIELDHPDHYQNLDQVIETFEIFAKQCQILVLSLDCLTIQRHFKPHISYSLDRDSLADYTASDIEYDSNGSTSKIWEKGTPLGTLKLQIPGKHNISNALAAIAVARYFKVDFEIIAQAMSDFVGAKRRFELKGVAGGITFIDDYAHHPSEIQATLSAARSKLSSLKEKRIVAVFQPHRFTRTAKFLDDFAISFADSDLVVLTDIYSAGEPNLEQIKGEDVVQSIRSHHSAVHYHQDIKSLPNFLHKILSPGDLVLFLGAGNLNQVIPQLIDFYTI
jgi:UDP-N-acetylmuramate--alanine ligase